MASFTERMIGAAKLNVSTYEEVERDVGSTGQAMAVVVLSSVAAGIGSAGGGFGLLIASTVAALVAWIIWAGLTFVIGTKLLPEPTTHSDIGELLRTIGFASSPGILQVLGILPFIGPLIRLVVSIWMLIAFVVAVRQALDYHNTGRAVLVCATGWVAYVVVSFFLMTLFGIGSALV